MLVPKVFALARSQYMPYLSFWQALAYHTAFSNINENPEFKLVNYVRSDEFLPSKEQLLKTCHDTPELSFSLILGIAHRQDKRIRELTSSICPCQNNWKNPATYSPVSLIVGRGGNYLIFDFFLSTSIYLIHYNLFQLLPFIAKPPKLTKTR